MNKPEKIVALKEMPCDRYEDGRGFIHATGRLLVYDDPRLTRYEYEGDGTVSLPTDEEEEERW